MFFVWLATVALLHFETEVSNTLVNASGEGVSKCSLSLVRGWNRQSI